MFHSGGRLREIARPDQKAAKTSQLRSLRRGKVGHYQASVRNDSLAERSGF
jgi:hypothetical protein